MAFLLSLQLIYSGTLNDLRADPIITYIPWNGNDQNNNKVKDGQYTLFIEATFKPSPGTPAHEVAVKYHFYHLNQLLKKLP